MDPYVYPHTNILKNKLNIQDAKQLIDFEAQLLIAGILDLSTNADDLDYQNYKSLQLIHRTLFYELYSWAGEFRTVNIYKSEHVLNGLSVRYSDKNRILCDLKEAFSWSTAINWHYSNPNLAMDFAMFMTKLWRIHPYREGNTRTISIFMKFFAEAKNLNFNAQILSSHPGYLRNALVLSAVEEAPELYYLMKMISDALHLTEIEDDGVSHENPDNYRTIDQYDVSLYGEKPFKTDGD